MITTDSACLLGEISDGTKRLLGQACPNQEQKSVLNKSHKVLSFCTGQSMQVSKTCSAWSVEKHSALGCRDSYSPLWESLSTCDHSEVAHCKFFCGSGVAAQDEEEWANPACWINFEVLCIADAFSANSVVYMCCSWTFGLVSSFLFGEFLR